MTTARASLRVSHCGHDSAQFVTASEGTSYCPRCDEEASLSRCRGRYSTGEFKGMSCIERGKEQRNGLPLCRVHAKVFDRWTKFGFDYVRSIVRLEWGQEL